MIVVEPSSERVDIWTDGSSAGRQKGKPGGFAFVALHGERRLERYGWLPDATNNQMELIAIWAGLTIVRPTPLPVVVYTDSEYAKNCLTTWWKKWVRNGWKGATGGDVSNRGIIEATIPLINKHKAAGGIRFKHVKGHSGITENERADNLAHTARLECITNIPQIADGRLQYPDRT